MTSPSRLRALIAEARPRQWVKNGLVWSAPAAAGELNEATALTRTAATFVAFCLVSSGTYFLNDIHDLDGDRAHPRKRMRPIASGRLSTRVGLVVGLALIVSGLGSRFGRTLAAASRCDDLRQLDPGLHLASQADPRC